MLLCMRERERERERESVCVHLCAYVCMCMCMCLPSPPHHSCQTHTRLGVCSPVRETPGERVCSVSLTPVPAWAAVSSASAHRHRQTQTQSQSWNSEAGREEVVEEGGLSFPQAQTGSASDGLIRWVDYHPALPPCWACDDSLQASEPSVCVCVRACVRARLCVYVCQCVCVCMWLEGCARANDSEIYARTSV